jgi:hypothetical protein
LLNTNLICIFPITDEKPSRRQYNFPSGMFRKNIC